MISSLWSDTDMHILFLLILIILCHKEFLFSFSPLNISWTDGKILNFKKGYSLFFKSEFSNNQATQPPSSFLIFFLLVFHLAGVSVIAGSTSLYLDPTQVGSWLLVSDGLAYPGSWVPPAAQQFPVLRGKSMQAVPEG